MRNTISTESFVSRAKAVHGAKYDYSETRYVNRDTRVVIICREHGPFEQFPQNHLKGCGCNACGVIRAANHLRSNSNEFIRKARLKHGLEYDYSRVDYFNNHTEVTIVCRRHGDFEQIPQSHLAGRGCPICGQLRQAASRRRSAEEFIAAAKVVHGDVYDYSYTAYKGHHSNVTIVCRNHGAFEQQARHHLNGHGCPMCAARQIAKMKSADAESFVKRATKVHCQRYDYSRVRYSNARTHVLIICPDHGGIPTNS